MAGSPVGPEARAAGDPAGVRSGGPARANGEPAGPAIDLQVAEALAQDLGRGIVRCDPADIGRLGAKVGDIVLLKGRHEAAARVMPAFPPQRGRAAVHMDGILRENAGASLDDRVSVGVGACRAARSLTLAAVGGSAAAYRDEAQGYLAHLLAGIPVLRGNRVRVCPFGARPRDFLVVDTIPEGVVTVSMETRIAVQGERAPDRSAGVSYEEIGGLGRELQRIRELVELPLKVPEVFERLGIDPPRGVLLAGPPGSGKTLIARAVAHETRARFFQVSGPEIMHKFYGESEAHLRQIFDAATRSAPSIVFIDEIDAIAPKREDLGGEKQVERRVVAQLLALLDGLRSRGQVVVIAATNLPQALDPALRRPGRFDREIVIGPPDRAGRLAILDIHTHGMPLAADVDLGAVAGSAHGFVGADLEALCREAAMHALRRFLPRVDLARGAVPLDHLLELEVTMADFWAALQEVEPSALREVAVEIPDVRWDQVGGLAEPRQILQETVEWPLSHPDLVRRMGTRPPRGILLSGPPGTGKTLLARAVASESGVNFICVSGPTLVSRYVGETERALREIMRKARQAAPCVVFFDEIDGLLPRRGGAGDGGVSDRLVTQFLAEFDGIRGLQGVVVLGATNRLDALDPALLRPGRFDVLLELPLPDAPARAQILAIHARNIPLARDVDIDELARATPGASGADLEALMSRAAWLALRSYLARSAPDAPLPCVTPGDVAAALEHTVGRRRPAGARET